MTSRTNKAIAHALSVTFGIPADTLQLAEKTEEFAAAYKQAMKESAPAKLSDEEKAKRKAEREAKRAAKLAEKEERAKAREQRRKEKEREAAAKAKRREKFVSKHDRILNNLKKKPASSAQMAVWFGSTKRSIESFISRMDAPIKLNRETGKYELIPMVDAA